MPTISLGIKYRKNRDLLLSAEDLLSLFFYGIDIKSKDGTKIGNDVFEMYIKAAQQEVEKYFAIKIKKCLQTEKQDYHRDDFFSSGFPTIQTSFKVNTPYAVLGMLNTVQQVRYPRQWLNSNKSEGMGWDRVISIVPNGSAVNADTNIILTGIMNQYGLQSRKVVPGYWTVQYDTGFDFDKIPYDLVNLIGMMASIGVFAQAGDLILGAGIASMSLGLDGLSQSISSTSSATNAGYGARITEYRKSIKEIMLRLTKYYKGFNFASL